MSKGLYFVMDKKNNYVDQEYLTDTNNYFIIYIFYAFCALYWIHAFYYKDISNIAILIGISSFVIFITLFSILNNYTTVIDPTNNSWVKYRSEYNGEFVTDLSNETKNLKAFDLNTTGLVVDKKFINKLKKSNVELIPSNKLSDQKENIGERGIIYDELISKNISYKRDSIAFQGYCLINILFTVLSLIWNVNKTLFNKILKDFLYATVLSVPLAFISIWNYKNNDYLSEYNIKTLIIFQAISITIALLTDILIKYTK